MYNQQLSACMSDVVCYMHECVQPCLEDLKLAEAGCSAISTVWLAVSAPTQSRLKVLQYQVQAVQSILGSRTLVKCSYETTCPRELLHCRTSDLTKSDLNRKTLADTC